MSKGSITISMTGETTVGRSEFGDAAAAEMQRMFEPTSPELLVVNGADFAGMKPGLVDRLYGHPSGYVTYGDDRTPPEGLLATLALARMNGRTPCIFLDGDCDTPVEPLAN